jgi:hypothetical protein
MVQATLAQEVTELLIRAVAAVAVLTFKEQAAQAALES